MPFQEESRYYMMNDTSKDYLFIENQSALKDQVALWAEEPVLAIDTEFMRTSTYYAHPGLIQIADAENVFLIDPLIVTDLSPLAVLLADPNIVKIIHAMSEDIELLYHAVGVIAQCVFDTQIAAAFLGYGASLGYQNLVSEVLEYPVDKSETRSDWLKRPLTDHQLAYAAKDAEYLILLHRRLEKELIEKQLLSAVFDETDSILTQTVLAWDQPEAAYLKLRGACELPLKNQRVLQRLVVWRDQLAQNNNVPKPWVFTDKQLIEFAANMPGTIYQLKSNKDIKPKSIRLYGENLLEQLANARELSESQTDDFVAIEYPVKGEELLLYKKLKKVVSEISGKTGIEAQLLGSRKMLENVVIHTYRHKNQGLPIEYTGWRHDFLGDRFELVFSSVDQRTDQNTEIKSD